MNKKLLKKIENEENVKILIDNFKEEFTGFLFCLEDEETKEWILNFRDTIFRRWLYSAVIKDTVVTPYFIINSIAQNIEKGNYSVMPHLKINVNEEGEINYNFRILYYSEEELPVKSDLEELMKFCNPTLTIKTENKFLIDRGEEFIEKINFRSAYYIEYLIDLAMEIGILKPIASIGCKCYQILDSYEDYEVLSNEEKVKLIIEKSIIYSNNKLNENFENPIKKEIALELIDNNKFKEDIYKFSNVSALDLQEMFENIEELGLPIGEEEVEGMKELRGMLGDEFGYYMLEGRIAVFTDIFFTNIFSYYLGIIRPFYGDDFEILKFISLLAEIYNSENQMAVGTALFILEETHDLTNFGEKIIKEKKGKIKKAAYELLNKRAVNSAIGSYLHDLEERLNELQEEYDEDDEEFYEISLEIGKHLKDFENYLLKEKNVSKKTSDKHFNNIFMFLNPYNGFKSFEEIKTIDSNDIDKYLSTWFIENVATSINSVKEQITSLNQYIKYLEKVNLIEKSNLSKIKDTLKNKDKYTNAYEKYEKDYYNEDL